MVKSNSDYVKLYHGIVHIYSKSALSNTRINSIISGWYKQCARIKFNERLSECLFYLTAIKKMRIPSLTIRLCHLKSKIFRYEEVTYVLALNVSLIKTPISFIDYIIYYLIFHFVLKGKQSSFSFIDILPKNIKKSMLIL
ncbi:hypothetical protein [Wolbachia endosymbiont (group E) of Neria commutata]|uniref:hypothetical protein n=1 Tax=Wolbachia endosymbiont (group E) of Neria commutata TaxID=3066149 RepID=UPI00397BD918